MSIITNISGIPLFTTIQEALNWASSNGLSGYHSHNYQNIKGYMGGTNHSEAVNVNNTKPSVTIIYNSPSTGGGGGGY